MELWGGMLRALLSGPGRLGGTWGRAFSSWRPHQPQAGLSATELVSQWTAVFEKRGIPEARESSEYIVAHVLGAKTFQSLRPGLRLKPLTPGQLQCVQELSSRRLQRMPVQYVLGEWDFCGLNLKMAPPVFIPRPETEELVEWVLEEVAQKPRAVEAQGSPLILEVGCGSGAISLSLLSQLPQSRVIAVDKAGAAISLARENAQRLQLQDRIWIAPLDVTLEGSWAHLLPWGPMDLLVSNPPYVFHQDMEQLAPEIRSYEDPAALDGGEKGMDVIVHLLALAPRLLKDSGSLFLEVDPRHPELVGSWLQRRPGLSLELVAVRRDFCGRPRFLHVRRSGPHGGCPVDAWPAPRLPECPDNTSSRTAPGRGGRLPELVLAPSHGSGCPALHFRRLGAKARAGVSFLLPGAAKSKGTPSPAPELRGPGPQSGRASAAA